MTAVKYWDGAEWKLIGAIQGPVGPAGVPGANGTVTIYNQPTDPGAVAVGSLWIDTDEAPSQGGVVVSPLQPVGTNLLWVDTDEAPPPPVLPAGHYMLGPYTVASGNVAASGGVTSWIYTPHSIGHTRYTVVGSMIDASYGYNLIWMANKAANQTGIIFKNFGTQISAVIFEFYHIVQP